MNYQVQLNNGQVINLKNAEFDAGVEAVGFQIPLPSIMVVIHHIIF